MSRDPKKIVCKLKKFIYDLKQTSHQLYHKFRQIIISFGFEINAIDDCVYHKFSVSKYIFLVLYVDDILFICDDIGLLHKIKRFYQRILKCNIFVMLLLYRGYRYIKIVLWVFLDYHKRVISIRYLRDMRYWIANSESQSIL